MNSLPRLGLFVLVTSLLSVVAACDEGEQLGSKIAHAAKRLRGSQANELTISFQPKESGSDYVIGISRIRYCPHPPCKDEDSLCGKNTFNLTSRLSYLCSLTLDGRTQAGKRYGGTDWSLQRYVGVPRALFVEKTDGEPTLILLRRVGDHVEIVDLR